MQGPSDGGDSQRGRLSESSYYLRWTNRRDGKWVFEHNWPPHLLPHLHFNNISSLRRGRLFQSSYYLQWTKREDGKWVFEHNWPPHLLPHLHFNNTSSLREGPDADPPAPAPAPPAPPAPPSRSVTPPPATPVRLTRQLLVSAVRAVLHRRQQASVEAVCEHLAATQPVLQDRPRLLEAVRRRLSALAREGHLVRRGNTYRVATDWERAIVQERRAPTSSRGGGSRRRQVRNPRPRSCASSGGSSDLEMDDAGRGVTPSLPGNSRDRSRSPVGRSRSNSRVPQPAPLPPPPDRQPRPRHPGGPERPRRPPPPRPPLKPRRL